MLNSDTKPLSILIADDHEIVSEAIASVLSAEGSFIATTVSSGPAAFTFLKDNTSVDILLLDINMSGMKGIDSFSQFVKLAAPGRVVIFSAFATVDFVGKAVELGVQGFIPKTTPLKSLSSILRLIASGQIYVPMGPAGARTGSHSARAFTIREDAVMGLVAQGHTNKVIAHTLALSEASVKMAIRSACKKLGAANRTQAALAYSSGTSEKSAISV